MWSLLSAIWLVEHHTPEELRRIAQYTLPCRVPLEGPPDGAVEKQMGSAPGSLSNCLGLSPSRRPIMNVLDAAMGTTMTSVGEVARPGQGCPLNGHQLGPGPAAAPPARSPHRLATVTTHDPRTRA